jgi:hypothetical protein
MLGGQQQKQGRQQQQGRCGGEKTRGWQQQQGKQGRQLQPQQQAREDAGKQAWLGHSVAVPHVAVLFNIMRVANVEYSCIRKLIIYDKLASGDSNSNSNIGFP